MSSPAKETTNKTDEPVNEKDESWVKKHCNCNPILCEIDEKYLDENFEDFKVLLKDYYAAAVAIIKSDENKYKKIIEKKKLQLSKAHISAGKLYGLIHARFILTKSGLDQMVQKFEDSMYGCCPRLLCEMKPVVPLGLSDYFGHYKVKTYCPLCNEIYSTKSSRLVNVDGALFGTSFPSKFLIYYPSVCPYANDPRMFSFQIQRLKIQQEIQAGFSSVIDKYCWQGRKLPLSMYINRRRSI